MAAREKPKACRRRVKAELRSLKGSKTPRDKLRKDWIRARCVACVQCPAMAAKFARKLAP